MGKKNKKRKGNKQTGTQKTGTQKRAKRGPAYDYDEGFSGVIEDVPTPYDRDDDDERKIDDDSVSDINQSSTIKRQRVDLDDDRLDDHAAVGSPRDKDVKTKGETVEAESKKSDKTEKPDKQPIKEKQEA